jgi:hypothetical protein
MGMQGTPAGNAMAGIAMPMPMMKGGYDMMDKDMMMKKGMMGGKRYSRKYMKGGMVYGGPLSPHYYDGKGVGTSGAGLQIMATTMN